MDYEKVKVTVRVKIRHALFQFSPLLQLSL